MSSVLDQLSAIIEQRRHEDPQHSYVSQLHERGLYKMLEKVGEESTEMILAATLLFQKNNSEAQVAFIKETADLWFHCLVALSYFGLDYSVVEDELKRRFSQSGLAEKASRLNA